MTVDEADEYDYAAAVIETLREAGRPVSHDELWDKIMRRTDVPADDREMYWTPPFSPGPHPRNFVMLKIVAQVSLHTDMGGHRPDAPLIGTEDGYWLPEWGPIPLKEQQLRQEIAEEWARRASEPAPRVWPELDPYPKTSLASEVELQEVAEKLVTFRSLVEGQRFVGPGSIRLGRAVQKRLEEDGMLDENRRYHEERRRKIEALMDWYGNAVRRTDGADPQDLYTLASIGLIRDPEKAVPTAEPDFATIRMDDNGAGVFAPTSTQRFAPDYRYDELHELITAFIREVPVTDSSSQGGLTASSDRYPSRLDAEVRDAIELKRQGKFLDSATIYVRMSRREGTVYTGILSSLYKTVACGGDLVNAMLLLQRGEVIYQRNPDRTAVAAGISSNFQDHMTRLFRAVLSPESLHDYLRDLSGNPGYQMPRGWAEMAEELRARIEGIQQAQKKLEQSLNNQSSGGCYVATSVYGDYDAPQVQVLRRWRDQVLWHSSLGRLFVRSYYAVSPSLVRAVGDRKWFHVPSRWVLDRLVRKLDS